jgi:hypothetical protein
MFQEASSSCVLSDLNGFAALCRGGLKAVFVCDGMKRGLGRAGQGGTVYICVSD